MLIAEQFFAVINPLVVVKVQGQQRIVAIGCADEFLLAVAIKVEANGVCQSAGGKAVTAEVEQYTNTPEIVWADTDTNALTECHE